jgi:hypothetical protein
VQEQIHPVILEKLQYTCFNVIELMVLQGKGIIANEDGFVATVTSVHFPTLL